MNEIIAQLSQYGALGIISGCLLYNTFKKQNIVLKVITDNTKALTELCTLIKNLKSSNKQ